MIDLSDALNILEAIVAALAIITAGDYIGYKIGRMRLVIAVGGIALVAVIAFAIYAAVVLQIARS